MRRKRMIAAWLRNILGLIIILIHFAPFYVLITTSLKVRGDYSSKWLLPSAPRWDNFSKVLENGKLMSSMAITFYITIIATIFIIVIGALAAYPLARYKQKLSKVISLALLGAMMVPPLSVLVPLYRFMVQLGGVNTYWGIIILCITYGLPLSVFMYSNFISTIPYELDEAALIDGCTRYSIFLRIILPSLKPVTATVTILSSLAVWNNYSFQLYMLQKPKMRTIILFITNYFGEGNTNINAAAAAACISMIPLIIIYLTLSKYFVQGAVDSAVK